MVTLLAGYAEMVGVDSEEDGSYIDDAQAVRADLDALGIPYDDGLGEVLSRWRDIQAGHGGAEVASQEEGELSDGEWADGELDDSEEEQEEEGELKEELQDNEREDGELEDGEPAGSLLGATNYHEHEQYSPVYAFGHSLSTGELEGREQIESTPSSPPGSEYLSENDQSPAMDPVDLGLFSGQMTLQSNSGTGSRASSLGPNASDFSLKRKGSLEGHDEDEPFKWRAEDGSLAVPTGLQIRRVTSKASTLAGSSRASSPGYDASGSALKPNTGSGAIHLKDDPIRLQRLMERNLNKGEIFQNSFYNLASQGSISGSGWQGKPPPVWARKEIILRYKNGTILDDLKSFLPLPYIGNKSGAGSALSVLDNQGRIFLFRSFQASFLKDKADTLYYHFDKLLRPTLKNSKSKKKAANGARGPHFASIIGHWRQSAQEPGLTTFHKKYSKEVDELLKQPIIQNMIKWVSSVVEVMFPGVAKRFRECAAWHKEENGIEPLFGLFWNLCINGLFPGQGRIHTLPHADSKNPISVCAVMVYTLPNSHFDHTRRSWLVIWEAGIIVELPPWVLVVYPSSLFFHFNIDITDIKFVTTAGAMPTPENSRPITPGDDQGRGSMKLERIL
ncbi:hypothetical protein BV25DRAFT_1839581 [Artomyces pyxidatus]|uniref:Uncharacterized protein n=1 Tax=Artomyces pyxidatus TaxID=48021 RepID=A0ACB8SX82_9AGAM|nr:hypothetical protein BV25DRAFT_1839581 [Artomyces pyxidatus]